MEKYYSKVKPDLLLHVVFRKTDFVDGRFDIIGTDNFLQCAAMHLNDEQTFRPHKHKERVISFDKWKAQESWVVIQGLVRCTFYDIDDTVLDHAYIKEGDASFTLHGGHTYESLEDDTYILEFKTGPYLGQEQDKQFI